MEKLQKKNIVILLFIFLGIAIMCLTLQTKINNSSCPSCQKATTQTNNQLLEYRKDNYINIACASNFSFEYPNGWHVMYLKKSLAFAILTIFPTL